MGSSHFILAAGWILYCALHSLLAGKALKSVANRLMGPRFPSYRLIYSLLAIALLIPLVMIHFTIRSPQLFIPPPPVRFTGILLAVAGIAGMAICLRKYLASAANLRDLFIEGVKPPLQVRGMHAYVRHPLYLFTFILLWGIFLFTPTAAVLIADVIITAYTILAIRWEEKKLVNIYGREYETYRWQTPMILPSIRSLILGLRS